MQTLSSQQQVPTHPFRRDAVTANDSFHIARSEGGLVYESDVLIPHRRAFYLLVFVERGPGRHWVDTTPFDRKDNAVYFTTPSQMLVKEEAQPFWGTHLKFTSEFLTLQQNAALRNLPLVQNLHNGHELTLSADDAAWVKDCLARLEAEYHRPGPWQHPMLSAQLTVLLTYLSRLYTEQFPCPEPTADQRLLKAYQARIEESFRELHEVGDYAALLHLSAGHLSEVVKAQSGRPAIKHLHERLVLEARRLLLYTDHSLKEIAFDLGFSDASYFNRFFKRETNVTPAEYRVSIRKMYQ